MIVDEGRNFLTHHRRLSKLTVGQLEWLLTTIPHSGMTLQKLKLLGKTSQDIMSSLRGKMGNTRDEAERALLQKRLDSVMGLNPWGLQAETCRAHGRHH